MRIFSNYRQVLMIALVEIALLTASAGSSYAEKPTVWIFLMEPIWRKLNHWPPNDFSSLVDETLWPTVIQKLSVFQFSEKYAEHGDIKELHSLVRLLNKYHVKIAIQGVALVATKACGLGVEGFGTAEETGIAAHRLETAGARISYIVFDEPLLFGHFFRGGKTTTACNLPIEEALKETVSQAIYLKTTFPGVQIGDSEAFGISKISPDAYLPALKNWLDGYKRLSGHSWDFFQCDILWSSSSWKEQFGAFLSVAKVRSIPVGIFLTGSPADHDDAQWSATIIDDQNVFKKAYNFVPQQEIVASWSDIPRRVLPETESDTFAGAVKRIILLDDQ